MPKKTSSLLLALLATLCSVQLGLSSSDAETGGARNGTGAVGTNSTTTDKASHLSPPPPSSFLPLQDSSLLPGLLGSAFPLLSDSSLLGSSDPRNSTLFDGSLLSADGSALERLGEWLQQAREQQGWGLGTLSTEESSSRDGSNSTESSMQEGESSDDGLRIVGGSRVEQEDRFPYMASLRHPDNGAHFCGGSLIAPRTVLTAAHCLDLGGDSNELPYIHISRYQSRGEESGIWFERRCIQKYLHPNWSQSLSSGKGDIGICILDESVDDVKPVQVPPEDLDVPDDDSIPLTVIGWGARQEGGYNVKDLMSVRVYKADLQYCRMVYGPTLVDSTQVCAGLPEGGADSCQGDSGGPMLLENEPSSSNQEDVLIGLVSFGSGCGEAGRPGVYTRVSRYRSWINEKLQETCARPSLLLCSEYMEPLPPSSMQEPYFDQNGPPSEPIESQSPPPSSSTGFDSLFGSGVFVSLFEFWWNFFTSQRLG